MAMKKGKPREPHSCPFCGWGNIRVMQAKVRKGIFKGSTYTYCWCRPCGTRGPWAYDLSKDQKENYNDCVQRWNERTV